MAELRACLAEAAAYLRQEADLHRSWTDGRRASGLGEAYDRRRREVAAERDRWADAIQQTVELLTGSKDILSDAMNYTRSTLGALNEAQAALDGRESEKTPETQS